MDISRTHSLFRHITVSSALIASVCRPAFAADLGPDLAGGCSQLLQMAEKFRAEGQQAAARYESDSGRDCLDITRFMEPGDAFRAGCAARSLSGSDCFRKKILEYRPRTALAVSFYKVVATKRSLSDDGEDLKRKNPHAGFYSLANMADLLLLTLESVNPKIFYVVVYTPSSSQEAAQMKSFRRREISGLEYSRQNTIGSVTRTLVLMTKFAKDCGGTCSDAEKRKREKVLAGLRLRLSRLQQIRFKF